MKLKSLIIASVIIAFASVSISCNAYSSGRPKAESGIIDLKNWDFSKSPVSLDGQWEFHWMKLLPQASFGKESTYIPDGYIAVPGVWSGFSAGRDIVGESGYATYRLRILTGYKGLMGLNIPAMSDSYRAWINGDMVASVGTVGSSPQESVPQNIRKIVHFYSNGNPLTLTIHMSNYHYRAGGIWESIKLGDSAIIQKNAYIRGSVMNILAGCLLIIALYNFIFFIFRREERFILFFSLLCFFVALRSSIITGGFAFASSSSLPWWLQIKIEYLAIFAGLISFILLICSLLSARALSKKFLKLKNLAIWIGAVSCLIVLITPYSVFSHLITPFAVYFALSTIFIAMIIIKSILLKRKGSVLLLLSFIIIIAAVTNDFLLNMKAIESENSTGFCILFFAIIQSIILSNRFSGAFHHVEILSKQLAANNNMIQKLTDQIDEKNHEMTQRMYSDRLTGLPNRQCLFVDIHATAAPTLLLIDIDAFKEINDFYGNRIGDFVLKEVAAHLKSLINEDTNKLYKLSVDEYAILIDDETMDAKKLAFFASTVCREISRKAITHEKNEIFIRITIGTALGSMIQGKKTFEDIIVRADMALKRAKHFAKPFLMYNDSMEIIKEYEKNMHWARKLKDAIESDRIIPYFQPIINNKTGVSEKYECLVRFIDDDGSVIPPAQFLEIAHKCRMYPEIMKIMIEKTFGIFKNNQLEFSINLSVDDILDVETRDYILGTLLMNRDTASRAIFEILESQNIKNYSEIHDFITEVKSFGCRIAVDDFGSGYSNFEHIIRLNIDFIKIDSSLVKNVHVDRNSQVIVKMIAVFAKELGIKTIAEFVHCSEVYERVKSLEIDYAQGFFLGEPRPHI